MRWGAWRPRWVRRLLSLCLLGWPRHHRERLGDSLIRAILDAYEAEERGSAWVVAECGAVLVGGLRVRWQVLRTSSGRRRIRPAGLRGQFKPAARHLRRAPAFTALCVTTLGVAIGAGAAVIGLAHGVILRPPDYRDPDGLVFLWNIDGRTGDRVRPSGPDVAALRDGSAAFSDVAFVNGVTNGSLVWSAGPVGHVRVGAASLNFFHTLGVVPSRGRTFLQDDREAVGEGAPTAAVISDGLWRSALGGLPEVVGATVRLNGTPVQILGILPETFRLALPPDAGVTLPVDVWVPMGASMEALERPGGRLADRDSDDSGVAVARLRPSVSLSAAEARVRAAWERIEAEVPGYAGRGLDVSVRPLHADATAHAKGLLRTLVAGVALLVFIACLNVSTLVLARGLNRAPEFALRRALGARGSDLLRQLSAETGVLMLLSVAAGVWVASGTARALRAWAPVELTGFAPWSWHPLTLASGAVVAGLLLLGFGSAPLVRSEQGKGSGTAALGRGVRRGRAREVLVLAEVAVSVVLVVGAGLLLRTAVELRAVRPGFDPDGALSFSVSLRAPGRFEGPADRARYVRDVESALAALPGVAATGIVVGLPLGGDRWTQPWGLGGTPPEAWVGAPADFRAVSSGYFEAMGIRLLSGRPFTSEEDVTEARRVAVVDVSLADALAPRGDAVGHTIAFPLDGRAVEAEVVGVVEHVRHHDLEADGAETIYVPYRQEASRDLSFVVRTSGDVESLIPRVREALLQTDPSVPVYGLSPLSWTVGRQLAPTRFALFLMVLFAALGVLAAAAGLYGVLAAEVGRRRPEIGIRMAVGASADRVLRDQWIRGVRFAAGGVSMGLVVAWVGAPAMEPLLFGVGPRDGLTWGLGALFVVAVVTLASWVPSRRASRLSPSAALQGG